MSGRKLIQSIFPVVMLLAILFTFLATTPTTPARCEIGLETIVCSLAESIHATRNAAAITTTMVKLISRAVLWETCMQIKV